MREMKDSGIEWIGKIPENWKVQRAKTLFSQRLTKGNQDITLLAATQKYGMLPQSEVEGVVQVKENADLLGAFPMISFEYSNMIDQEQLMRTDYYLYISATKGNTQYLDSLDGSNSITDTGKYKKATIYTWKEYLEVM